MDKNQVDEISIVGHGNVNKKERNQMVFEQIADPERNKQGRSIDKIINCCTKLGIDRSHRKIFRAKDFEPSSRKF